MPGHKIGHQDENLLLNEEEMSEDFKVQHSKHLKRKRTKIFISDEEEKLGIFNSGPETKKNLF